MCKWTIFSFLNLFLCVICWAVFAVAGREFSPWGKTVSLSMSSPLFQSLFPLCPVHLYSEKLMGDRWLAQEFRESLHSSPGTAFCTKGSKTKHEGVKGLQRHGTSALRLLRCPVEESDLMWILLQPAGLVQSSPPSSHLFQGVQSYPCQYVGTGYTQGITSTTSRNRIAGWPRQTRTWNHKHTVFTVS